MTPVSWEQTWKALKDSGYRLTATRRKLIELLLRREGHWTIHDIVSELRSLMPKVGVATIYRTVNLLVKHGILSETRIGGSSARYELASIHHHDHLTCTTCGEIFEFQNNQIERLQKKVAEELGFSLIDHRMELYGECVRPRCRRR